MSNTQIEIPLINGQDLTTWASSLTTDQLIAVSLWQMPTDADTVQFDPSAHEFPVSAYTPGSAVRNQIHSAAEAVLLTRKKTDEQYAVMFPELVK